MNRIKNNIARGGLLAGLALATAAPCWAHDHPQPPQGWTKITDLAPARGMDGKMHTATCSGFPGTDPTFSFWARKGKSRNLAIYFEGGGACWDNLTCTFPIAGLPAQVPQFFMPAIAATTDPAAYDGIFRAGEPTNPVGDWNFVYIPYCTGDLHAGSATKTYSNVGHPALPLPPTFDIQHRGFDNFMVVMNWVRRNFDDPQKVLVAGSSAGGYGASTNFPWVQRAYPRSHLYVLADASQGVTTDAWDQNTPGRGSWNMQLAPWAFGPNAAQVTSHDLLRTAAQANPKVKVAQFTTALDGVQIGFYGLMKSYYGPGGACPNPVVDWNGQMLDTLQSYATDVDNFRYYLAAGDYHTNLRSPLFYTEASTGVAYSHWVASMLANRGGRRGHGGGDWQDLACVDCLAPLPCP